MAPIISQPQLTSSRCSVGIWNCRTEGPWVSKCLLMTTSTLISVSPCLYKNPDSCLLQHRRPCPGPIECPSRCSPTANHRRRMLQSIISNCTQILYNYDSFQIPERKFTATTIIYHVGVTQSMCTFTHACIALIPKKFISCVKHNKGECDTLLLLFYSPENSTKALHFMFDLSSVIDIWNGLWMWYSKLCHTSCDRSNKRLWVLCNAPDTPVCTFPQVNRFTANRWEDHDLEWKEHRKAQLIPSRYEVRFATFSNTWCIKVITALLWIQLLFSREQPCWASTKATLFSYEGWEGGRLVGCSKRSVSTDHNRDKN